MRINKVSFLILLISLFMPCFMNAQTVKYVAFFPVPYVTHMKIETSNAFFAGRDEGKVEVQGSLSTPTITASKDLDLSDVSGSSVDLTAGFYAEGEYGDFIASGNEITFSSFTSGSQSTDNVQKLSADENMKLKTISWDNVLAFSKGTASPTSNFSMLTGGAPSDTTKLCWSPLRIKGTFEYQYYLIAYNGDTCP